MVAGSTIFTVPGARTAITYLRIQLQCTVVKFLSLHVFQIARLIIPNTLMILTVVNVFIAEKTVTLANNGVDAKTVELIVVLSRPIYGHIQQTLTSTSVQVMI